MQKSLFGLCRLLSHLCGLTLLISARSFQNLGLQFYEQQIADMGYQIVAVLEDIRRNLYLFLLDRMSVSDFTNWLHSRSDLESIIGVDLVNQLCNLDFSEPVNVAPVLEHLADIFTKKWPGYLESLEPCIEQIEIFLASKRPYPECVDYFYLVQIEYIKYGTRGPELS